MTEQAGLGAGQVAAARFDAASQRPMVAWVEITLPPGAQGAVTSTSGLDVSFNGAGAAAGL